MTKIVVSNTNQSKIIKTKVKVSPRVRQSSVTENIPKVVSSKIKTPRVKKIKISAPLIASPASLPESGFSDSGKLILELQLAFKVANSSHFKELIFTSGQLTNISIYTNSGKAIKLFNKNLTYASGLLSQVLLTRISDSKTITKNLIYDGNNNLQTIDIIAS